MNSTQKVTTLTPLRPLLDSVDVGGWIFTPDLLNGFHSRQAMSGRGPELRLQLAVLEDAIYCYQVGARYPENGKKRNLAKEAETWILAEDDGDVFSFNNICARLGFDKDYVRKGIAGWAERERKEQEILTPMLKKHARHKYRRVCTKTSIR